MNDDCEGCSTKKITYYVLFGLLLSGGLNGFAVLNSAAANSKQNERIKAIEIHYSYMLKTMGEVRDLSNDLLTEALNRNALIEELTGRLSGARGNKFTQLSPRKMKKYQ